MRREHAFYFHNNAGDVTFRYNEIYELGRTAVQIVARIFETVYGPAPVNTGQITFFGNLVADTGLSVLDGCRGGQSFTVTGRNDGFIDIRHNVFAHGYDVFTDGLRDAMEETCDAPIGMGSIVFWTTDAENYGTSGLNIIDKNYAFYHPDAGVRPAFSISASEGSLIARNTIQMGLLFPPQHAIELGKSGGSPSYPAPEQYCVRDNTLINGDFEILGNDAQQPAFDGPLGAQACQ